MTTDDTLAFIFVSGVQIILVGAASDRIASFPGVLKVFPERIRVRQNVMIISLRCRASQVRHRGECTALADHTVRAVKFGPSFLDQHGPDLARVCGVREARQLG